MGGSPASPGQITEQEALKTLGPDAVYYGTSCRGISNQKAKHVFGFNARPLEWLAS